MKKIMLIALDMDGTLLDSKKRISTEVKKALHIAKENGVQCVLSTGRAISELNPYRDDLRDVRYWMCESGALIYDSREDKIIRRMTIDSASCLKVLDVLDALHPDVMVQIMRGGIVEVNAAQVPLMARYFMSAYISLFKDTASKTKDIASDIRSNPNGIEKINIYHTDAVSRERTKDALFGLPIEKSYAETTSLELSAIGMSKGEALRYTANMLGIPMEQTAAAGDSDNDESILQTAAVPIVMGNAAKHIKALAHHIVADCDHGGAAEAILWCLNTK